MSVTIEKTAVLKFQTALLDDLMTLLDRYDIELTDEMRQKLIGRIEGRIREMLDGA